eukprot:CAMPEP_0183294394 /NCGR_PEP_ID=MMETSP0160_2-20130417/2757_1 /TAXON_ID=2839 ORGANISM="Odontella Sinensis, Strain Grunow 1884" /NCGR_SAMPLE_ID=MMETSP0160_2 /ASSEMBLY_ACC=CAM_ASM_000250 /LENGTH=225 /DNA_ID=CAMNT_0025455715 /DNA_START=70 /DNA_END=747 /DNA_ORIENTATION=+
MGGFHSKPKKKAPPGGTISDVDRAVLDLKNARDRLQKYRTKLDADEKKILERAKKSKAAGDEKGALILLRLRKHKLKEADNVNAQLLTVLEMVDTIAGKENEKEIVAAMRTGKDALKALHDEMGVDEILDLMDEVQEGNEVEKQISDIIAQGAGMDAADESEVERELEELEREMAAEAAEAAGEAEPATVPSMPEVPTSKLPEVGGAEKEEGVGEARPGRVAVAS